MALVSMMLAALAPTAAETWEERRETWRERREAFAERRENFRETYELWLDARSEFRSALNAWRENPTPSNRLILTQKARAMAILAYHLRLSYLRHLRARAEATRGLLENDKDPLLSELDGYISTIESYGENIRQLVQTENENREKIREAARELRDYWLSIRVRVKQITAQLIVAGFRALVERAKAFAARVEAKIEELKDNGVETTALENWLADFNDHIELAEDWLDNAEEKVNEITDNVTFRQIFRVAIAHVRQALIYLRNAFRNLKDIVLDMRGEGHTIILMGSGTFIGEGSGTVDISLQGGVVKIWGRAENSTVIISPDAKVHEFENYTKTVLDNGMIQYQGTGYGKVTGHDITVHIESTDMRIEAHGTGTLTATGTGWYKTFGENRYMGGDITEEGISVTLATGEVQG